MALPVAPLVDVHLTAAVKANCRDVYSKGGTNSRNQAINGHVYHYGGSTPTVGGATWVCVSIYFVRGVHVCGSTFLSDCNRSQTFSISNNELLYTAANLSPADGVGHARHYPRSTFEAVCPGNGYIENPNQCVNGKKFLLLVFKTHWLLLNARSRTSHTRIPSR